MLVTIIITVLLGALVGWAASKVMNRDSQQGWVGNVLVGVAGAVVGTLVLNQFRGTDPFITFNLLDVVVAFLGALVVSAALNYVQTKRIRP